jgi:RNA polymerase subunit RPABC4/transcription elongation factor Spt4
MSRFQDEVELVPRPAFAIGVCVWLAFFLLMMLLPIGHDPELRNWPMAGKLAIAALPGLPLFFLTLLVGYVYADAKRRGMRYVMWTWLAALIPNAIGIILYFVLRDPLLVDCTHCGTQVRTGFAFCPKCGGSLSQACPQCRRAVETGWTHCVYCGASLSGAGL